MKFVIAPDKYKGSLTGKEFCDAVARGLIKVFPEAQIIKIPLADGGDGTLEVIKDYLQADEIKVTVSDPLFRKIDVNYLYSKHTGVAFIEMSEASGYKLLEPADRNCLFTTTFGTGELIKDALDRGATEIILGIGGSATNDAGIGLAAALGYEFLDETGNTLQPIGANLIHIDTIQDKNLHGRLKEVSIKVACDVTNPFYGPNGAAYVYAEQKGATPQQIEVLDQGLRNLAQKFHTHYDIDVQKITGSGAAGGVGGGAKVFLNAQLRSGIELIKDLVAFEEHIKEAHCIITGEGMLDEQTLAGKTVAGVLASAKKYHVPVAALCGSVNLTMKSQEKIGLDYVVSILKNVGTLEDAMENAFDNLTFAAYNFASIWSKK